VTLSEYADVTCAGRLFQKLAPTFKIEITVGDYLSPIRFPILLNPLLVSLLLSPNHFLLHTPLPFPSLSLPVISSSLFHCPHPHPYLLPDKPDYSSVTDRLRHAKTFEQIPARTNKFENNRFSPISCDVTMLA